MENKTNLFKIQECEPAKHTEGSKESLNISLMERRRARDEEEIKRMFNPRSQLHYMETGDLLGTEELDLMDEVNTIKEAEKESKGRFERLEEYFDVNSIGFLQLCNDLISKEICEKYEVVVVARAALSSTLDYNSNLNHLRVSIEQGPKDNSEDSFSLLERFRTEMATLSDSRDRVLKGIEDSSSFSNEPKQELPAKTIRKIDKYIADKNFDAVVSGDWEKLVNKLRNISIDNVRYIDDYEIYLALEVLMLNDGTTGVGEIDIDILEDMILAELMAIKEVRDN